MDIVSRFGMAAAFTARPVGLIAPAQPATGAGGGAEVEVPPLVVPVVLTDELAVRVALDGAEAVVVLDADVETGAEVVLRGCGLCGFLCACWIVPGEALDASATAHAVTVAAPSPSAIATLTTRVFRE